MIGEGDTQWMTAGGGILHDEVPTERHVRDGGPFHGVQLWVNLPPALKLTPPRYQAITGDGLLLFSSDDGGALVRLIAGDLAGHRARRHPHADHVRARDARTRRPALGAVEPRRSAPWRTCCSARGTPVRRAARSRTTSWWCSDPATTHRRAPPTWQAEPLDVLLLGGLPIGEPIAHYGPFVMNTREEILQAVDDFKAGRMGTVPADQLAPRSSA